VRWQVLDAAATNLGERVMRPEWGVNARDYLYRPADALERGDAAAVVRQRLKAFVPRATIGDVIIENFDFDPNTVNIEIHYRTSPFVGATGSTVSVTTAIGEVEA
jgi:phage baseplate assembly protein W